MTRNKPHIAICMVRITYIHKLVTVISVITVVIIYACLVIQGECSPKVAFALRFGSEVALYGGAVRRAGHR